MSEWKEYKLEEIGQVVGGATPSTKEPSYYDGQISWITPKDLSVLTSRYISRGERNITQRGLDSCSCKILPKNSVLFSSRAPIGYVAIANREVCTNQGFKSVIPNENLVYYKFLYYLLLYNKDNIANLGSGTTFMEVSGSVMKNYVVKIPSLIDQKKIASVLSSLDDKIETNRAINARLEELASSIFKSKLADCENYITIGELCYNILDYSPNDKKFVRLINSADVTDGVFQNYPLVENKELKGHFKKRFKYGDILYSEIRPRNHHYGLALFDGEDYIISTRLMVLRSNPEITSPYLLYQYLLLPEVEASFTAKTEGRSGTFPQGNFADMASIVVPFDNTIKSIDGLLKSIRERIQLNNKEILTLASLRDTLLPRLMSGELIPE